MRPSSGNMLNVWLSPPGLVKHCSTSNRLTARLAMSGSRGIRVERYREPSPGLERGLVGVALNFKEPAPRKRPDFRAAEALEQLDAAVAVRAAGGLGADQHQFRRMGGMARGVGQRDHAAE
jgi:hypothetical protein